MEPSNLSVNTFSSMTPLMKEVYSKGMKTHVKPGKEERFKQLKLKLKK